MSSVTRRTTMRRVVLITVCTMLLLASAAATADSGCQKVKGKVSVVPFAPEEPCEALACGHAEFTGSMKGTGETSIYAFNPNTEGGDPAVMFVNSNGVWHVWGGDLFVQEAIVLRMGDPTITAEVDTITGGTGAWAGASGVVSATATSDGSGVSEGAYEGYICTP